MNPVRSIIVLICFAIQMYPLNAKMKKRGPREIKLKKYCIEQGGENTRFVSRTSWKDKIKKSIPENISVT